MSSSLNGDSFFRERVTPCGSFKAWLGNLGHFLYQGDCICPQLYSGWLVITLTVGYSTGMLCDFWGQMKKTILCLLACGNTHSCSPESPCVKSDHLKISMLEGPHAGSTVTVPAEPRLPAIYTRWHKGVKPPWTLQTSYLPHETKALPEFWSTK